MNTKILMTASALFLGISGIIMSFLPQEIIAYLNIEANVLTSLFLQIISALYMGFGILNWMAKGTRIGGIYNRPVAIGNFMHFGIGAITLVKLVLSVQVHELAFIMATIIYAIFAISFAYVFMTNPADIN
jgi:hypothetical protein